MEPEPCASRLGLAVSKAATATADATRAWTRLAELAVKGREPTAEQRIEATLAVRQAQMHLAQTSEALVDFARATSAAIDDVIQEWRALPPVGNA
jgi:hypothetical protein